jgi:hypothetical protein
MQSFKLASALLLLLSGISADQSLIHLVGAGLRVEIRPTQGGRISSFTLNGKEVLITPETEAGRFVFGNSFWTAPQSVWNWPPPKAHDETGYRITQQSKNSIQLSGSTDSLTGIRMTKEIRLNLQDTSLTVSCTYVNASNKPQTFAPWEISRSPKGGVVFWPKSRTVRSMRFPFTPDVSADGTQWYTIPAQKLEGQGVKLNVDLSAGWQAYAYNGLLFIKTFQDQQTADLCPGEGDAELYVSPVYDYIELEETGRYQTVSPGQSVHFETRWYVRAILPSVPIQTKSGALLAMVRRLVR